MAADLNRRTWRPTDVNTPEEKRAASLYVASIATSKADATHLLDVLGLLPARLRVVEHGMPGYRAGCRCKTCRSANARRTREQRRDAKTGATLFETQTPATIQAWPTVYGLDLSLTSTGISNGLTAEALIPKNLDGHARLEFHRRSVHERIPDETSLVVMEGPAMSLGYRPGVEEMTYLRGLVKHDLWRRRIPLAVCYPQHRIIYATGVANPAKDYPASKRKTVAKGMVRDAVVQRYGVPCEGRGSYDQADSVILAAIGLHWLGYPLAVVPDSHRRALKQVAWPENVPAVAR